MCAGDRFGFFFVLFLFVLALPPLLAVAAMTAISLGAHRYQKVSKFPFFCSRLRNGSILYCPKEMQVRSPGPWLSQSAYVYLTASPVPCPALTGPEICPGFAVSAGSRRAPAFQVLKVTVYFSGVTLQIKNISGQN